MLVLQNNAGRQPRPARPAPPARSRSAPAPPSSIWLRLRRAPRRRRDAAGPRRRHRVRQRPVRQRDGGALAERLVRLLRGGHRATRGQRIGGDRHAQRRRAAPDPRRVERHRPASGPTAHPAELFEAQVARTPDAVALVFDGPSADLRRAGRARQPAGPSADRPRRRAREHRRGCAWSARPRWSSRCSPSSRPVPPTCRSTRTIPPSGSPSCSTTPGRCCVAHRGRPLPTACPTARCCSGSTTRRSRPTSPPVPAPHPRPRPPPRRSTPGTPPTSSTPPAPPAGPRASSSRTQSRRRLAWPPCGRGPAIAATTGCCCDAARLRRRRSGSCSCR